MTITIGRGSFNDPRKIRHSGDAMLVELDIHGVTVANAKSQRDQILGLSRNRDEPIVPVVWSLDDTYDGYYAIGRSDVEPMTRYLSTGHMTASVELYRLPSYHQPLVEVVATVAKRSTAVSTPANADLDWTIALPAASEWVSGGSPFDASPFVRSTDTGDLIVLSDDTTPDVAGTYVLAASIPAADYYDGACVIKYYNGEEYRTVVGRQIPTNDPSEILFDNGIVRFVLSASSDRIFVSGWGSNGWESVDSFELSPGRVGVRDTAYQLKACSIISNSPQCVTLEYLWNVYVETLPLPGSLMPEANMKFTVTLRRGSHIAYCSLSSIPPDPTKAVNFSGALSTFTSQTSTSTTGGLYSNSTNVNSHKWVMATAEPYSSSTAISEISFGTSQPTHVFGLGIATAGTSFDGPAAVIGQWWMATNETLEVVAR